MTINILGISAYYHDSAACLVQDGKIVAACQEERFTRKKHDFDFPRKAAEQCMKIGGIKPDDLNFVVFYDKPLQMSYTNQSLQKKFHYQNLRPSYLERL